MTSIKEPSTSVDLSWCDVSYRVMLEDKKWKTIVQPISGRARAGRVLAIMGPSGAGKTTFLNSLCGRIAVDAEHELDGVVYLNDTVLTHRYRNIISFVMQDDICMGKNTPRETIYLSRRLTTGCSDEEATQATSAILERMSMQACADTLIGIPGLISGISGGEKKRTNIACELVNDPSVVFLDEPTTGLDSVNALRVGNLLQLIARADQRTVICTIHTPSSELYALFDDILLLADGRLVYHGPTSAAPAYFSRLGRDVPHLVNPAEHFLEVLQAEDVSDLAARFPAEGATLLIEKTAVSDEATMRNPSLATRPAESKLTSPELEHLQERYHVASCVGETLQLFKRSWQLTVRDPGATIGRLVQTLFFALLTGILFVNVGDGNSGVQDRQGVIFFLSMNTFMMNVIVPLASFPPERAVFLNEMKKDLYSPVAYYMAKTLAEVPLHILFNTIMIIIVYWMAGLVGTASTFFTCFGIMMAFSYATNALGVFIASLFVKQEVAMSVVPMMILPMLLVGGLFANTARLEPYWVWLEYLSLFRYGYKAFMINEFSNVKNLCPPSGMPPVLTSNATSGNVTVVSFSPSLCRFRTGADVLKLQGFDAVGDTIPMMILAIMLYMLGLRIVGAFGLWVQARGVRLRLVFDENEKRRLKDASQPIAA